MRTLPSERSNDRAPGKLDLLDRWMADPANWQQGSELAAQAKAARCQVETCLYVLTRLVMAAVNGRCSETYAQLQAKTGIHHAKVQRALMALTRAGVLVTIQRAKSPGRAGKGQAGRPAVRRITLLDQLGAATVDRAEMTAHSGRNDRAPERAAPRTLSTENPPRSKSRNAPQLTLAGRGANEHQTAQRTWSSAEQQLARKVAQYLCREQGSAVRSERAWTQHKLAQVLDTLAELQASSIPAVAERWQVAAQLAEPGGARHAVVVLAARTKGETETQATAQLLDNAIADHRAAQAVQPA